MDVFKVQHKINLCTERHGASKRVVLLSSTYSRIKMSLTRCQQNTRLLHVWVRYGWLSLNTRARLVLQVNLF